MIEGVLETALYADDLDKAEAFYGGVLGLEIIRRGGNRHIFYRCGSGVLLIFNPDETEKPIENDPFPVPPHGARGPGHACFVVSRDDVDAFAAKLSASGIAIEQQVTWRSGTRSIYFRDPAGNSLEIAPRNLWNP
ncbi:VOC family protein [Rhizobium sp. CSW-27]|uniref:VOC family protein n=1 Tax=Rhizobium sp. CSW-27 TaxID=2839985 RepID=UPI001C0389A5|nr:VOC family protein [Rhizobium sp. CSW-27]MBT9372145.1 VOC family protein [Rhizobium sp. CSW-27]